MKKNVRVDYVENKPGLCHSMLPTTNVFVLFKCPLSIYTVYSTAFIITELNINANVILLLNIFAHKQ